MSEQDKLDPAVLLGRIDERTLGLQKQLKEINDSLRTNYVQHEEFEPVKKLVYGLVAVIMSSVLIGLLALILKGAA